jgi:LPS-assembly protein
LGMTYRYPWVSNQKWGQTIVEPVAQMVLRPNEMAIGKMPNEDAQSLVFDDSTLFAPSKFSGWDRNEGGGRLNYGINFTTRLNNGFYFNALFGQSRHLFGINSYLLGDPNNTTGYIDMAGTGANSGLDKPRSDYVARLQLRPMQNVLLSGRFRFDEKTLKVMRTEIDASILYKNISFVASYADYAERPLLGFNTVRKGIGGAVGYKFYDNYTAFFAARYDLDLDRLDGISTSLNYLDDCYFMSAQYTRAFAYGAAGYAKPPDDHRFLFRVGLRTVGDTKYSRTILQ